MGFEYDLNRKRGRLNSKILPICQWADLPSQNCNRMPMFWGFRSRKKPLRQSFPGRGAYILQRCHDNSTPERRLDNGDISLPPFVPSPKEEYYSIVWWLGLLSVLVDLVYDVGVMYVCEIAVIFGVRIDCLYPL